MYWITGLEGGDFSGGNLLRQFRTPAEVFVGPYTPIHTDKPEVRNAKKLDLIQRRSYFYRGTFCKND